MEIAASGWQVQATVVSARRAFKNRRWGACGRREAAASHMTAHLTLVAGVGRGLQGVSTKLSIESIHNHFVRQRNQQLANHSLQLLQLRQLDSTPAHETPVEDDASLILTHAGACSI